ncbi:MAG TPA: DUF2310 family Zn-ribbon-containing protein [Clostridia bacterium]
MYSYEYRFYPDISKIEIEEFCDIVLSRFISSLTRNGQIIDQHWNIIAEGEVIKFICLAINIDSLDSKYHNNHCKKFLKELNELSFREPDYILIGKTLLMSDVCKCTEPSYYILFTTSSADYSPISCGDCDLAVPLYKFPILNDDEDYYTIRGWETEYQACDSLFMNTRVGEKYGYRQISNINSTLSVEGLEICKKMSSAVGKPFFYFLHKWYSPQKDYCPICGEYWRLDECLHDLYTHKCDKCFIMSDSPKK